MGKLILLLTVLIWLQYSLWFGKNGFQNYNRINNDVITYKITNAKLRERNNRLAIEIEALIEGQEAIEERARNELNMIKPEETFYRLEAPKISKQNHDFQYQIIDD